MIVNRAILVSTTVRTAVYRNAWNRGSAPEMGPILVCMEPVEMETAGSCSEPAVSNSTGSMQTRIGPISGADPRFQAFL